jgi:hypothetical protein
LAAAIRSPLVSASVPSRSNTTVFIGIPLLNVLQAEIFFDDP